MLTINYKSGIGEKDLICYPVIYPININRASMMGKVQWHMVFQEKQRKYGP